MSGSFRFDDDFNGFGRDFKKGMEDFAKGLRDVFREFADSDFSENIKNEGGRCRTYHFEGAPRSCRTVRPDGALVFDFRLPGLDTSAVDLTFRGDTMLLSVKVPESVREFWGEERLRGLGIRDIERREFEVPADRYDQIAAKATFRNGILTVVIPSKEPDQGETIRVNVSGEDN